MIAWHALATVLVATAHVVLSFCSKPSLSPTLLPHSSYSAHLLGCRSTTRHTAHTRHWDRNMEQGSSLWWRRHRKEDPGVSLRLSPADTGMPEVAPHNVGPVDNPAVAASAQQEDAPRRRSNRSGLLLLSTVPLVWGTYAPSVKYLYQMAESTPGLVFNLACYAVSVLTLAVVAGINNARKREGGFESLKYMVRIAVDVRTRGRSHFVLGGVVVQGERRTFSQILQSTAPDYWYILISQAALCFFVYGPAAAKRTAAAVVAADDDDTMKTDGGGGGGNGGGRPRPVAVGVANLPAHATDGSPTSASREWFYSLYSGT